MYVCVYVCVQSVYVVVKTSLLRWPHAPIKHSIKLPEINIVIYTETARLTNNVG